MIKAKTYPDFKEFVKGFIANVKAGKRYDFRTYQEAILPLTYSSYWPEADIAEVEEFDYKPDYKVPFSDELLYSIGAQMRTSDFFMDLQYAIINGKDVDTIYCEWLARVKPFSMLNAKLKDAIKPPAITQQPTNQTVNEGGTLTLSVVATNATGYQWKKDGEDITSATSATYTKQSVLPSDAGSYTCVVSGEAGTSVTSDAATVTVNALPVITQQPSGQTVNEGGNINLEVTATGATGYQWKKDGSDIPSATNDTYSKSGALPADAGSYTCVVTGAGGAVTSNAAVVTVNALPVITQQPTNQEITEGGTLTLNVAATGATGYQWKKGEEDILDATTATYTKEGATAADAGSYTCVVTGAGGSVTSNAATVTVNPAGEA
ncbi:immunoglobulin domain-containing protein [Staphylococcus hyicus]|uniref:immunoglobulin domain-containing protein n=1 Tax=Staphylococcus hyicus TaxID=1284 RepID=UPI00208F8E7B|nr:immunoglobulin domain-containing protein [Staphylococcus hyicus]MCO4330026.1 immunoglobulin domain-containing protein [Staphylococcus hyicus]MCO4332000.1 immunoglobulin domain-containing protein [Staphylococcus hyicus]